MTYSGAVTTRTGTTATVWKFTGEQADDSTGDSGYYYFRARHYDSATGRFLGRDKIQFSQRYAYAQNNPGRFADPSGQSPLSMFRGAVDMVNECSHSAQCKTAI